MNSSLIRNLVLSAGMSLLLAGLASAQQDPGPIQGNADQASQPSGSGVPGSSSGASATAQATAPTHASNTPKATDNATAPAASTASQPDPTPPPSDEPRTVIDPNAGEANANNPLLEPAALPKTKPTLIGGTAARVDHIRNQLTIQPFGGGQKIKVFIDERSHVYRNGEETTVLGIRKGDRVYVDTMLDGARVFAKNVRVETNSSVAEVRGQVTGVNVEKGTVTVRDELSSQPVAFAVGSSTQYSALRGTASGSDLQPGSMVDVQFALGKDKHDIAKEVILLAKPGDTYVFAGVVTNIDLRSNTLALENRSDEQTYELHFEQSAVDDRSKLKVGSEVTAHVVFNGKQYNANDLQLQAAKAGDADKSKEQ